MKKKPSLKDFRISENDLAAASRIKIVLTVLAIAWSILAIVFAEHLAKHAWLLLAISIPPYGTFAIYFAAKFVVRVLLPSFGRAVAYEAAVEEYQKWWIRTQSDF